ncbi:MAG: S26 family signal peptidase [Planctomycetes bacterium]|nr:S26 family signal peptidase [Planctomycetota bacterium]
MPEAHHVRLIASGIQAELESIRVHRDMYYIPLRHMTPWRGIQLGPGEYFAMGDNAPSSSDGRYWGSIPEKNLMGKALLVFWPGWPTNFQWKFIR